MLSDVVFTTQGISKVFDTGTVKIEALRHVDLELYAGELAVLLGQSGSGKSSAPPTPSRRPKAFILLSLLLRVVEALSRQR